MGDAARNRVSGRRWTFGWCEYSEVGRVLKVSGVPVEIESKPLDVLELLLEQPAEPVAKDLILEMVWGSTAEQSLAVAISKLRRAFGGARDELILTVTGVGYRMAVPVACKLEDQSVEQWLELTEGSPIPGSDGWIAERRLPSTDLSPVWLATRTDATDRHVYKFALDGIRLRSMQREVMVARLLAHELPAAASWWVPILSWNFETAPYYIESQYCGESLAEWSKSELFLAMGREARLRLAVQLAEAVAAAHSRVVLHNDLKPSNILVETIRKGEALTSPEPALHLRISDFGAGLVLNRYRLAELEITEYEQAAGNASSGAKGSFAYQAPEVRSGGSPTVQADVYAVGLLVFQIVTGDLTRSLSPGWEAAVPDRLLASDIAAATQMNPADRLASAGELAARLRALPERAEETARSEAARLQELKLRQELDRMRVRRPWIIAAGGSLFVGLCVSLALYRHAFIQEKQAKEQSRTVSAMFDFVARDLIGQSNPYLTAPPRSGGPETLDDAITASLPRIDERFQRKPLIAAKLHETAADSFRAQTQYRKADAEYRRAEVLFRTAEGESSQKAALVEFKRENAELSGRLPGAVADATSSFARQSARVAAMTSPAPELLAWKAMLAASIAGLGPHPEAGLPQLSEAIRGAKSQKGFDPALLIAMEARVCGIYVRLQDGAKVTDAARDLSAQIERQYGSDSPYLPIFQMYLQEGLYLQGKFRESIAQANLNLPKFERVLGHTHELTLAILGSRAASESRLGLYAAAASDDLQLYSAEAANSSGGRLRIASLADAARNKCESSQYADGIAEAKQVIHDAASGPEAQPMFASAAKFFLADCMVDQAEHEKRPSRQADAREAATLIRTEDAAHLTIVGADIDFPALKNSILARSSALQK